MRNYILTLCSLCLLGIEGLHTLHAEENAAKDRASSASERKGLGFIDTDGEFMLISNWGRERDFLKSYYADFKKLEEAGKKKSKKDFVKDISAIDLLIASGVDSVAAWYASSKKIDETRWSNKYYLETSGESKGLFKVGMNPLTAWQSPLRAPSSADWVIEQNQNIGAFLEGLQSHSHLFGPDFSETLKKALDHIPEGQKKTNREYLADLVLSVNLMMELDESHSLKLEGGKKLPNLDLAVEIKGGSKIWHFIAEEIEKESVVYEEGDLKYVIAPKEYSIAENFPKLSPMFVIDKSTESLWFTFRKSYFEKVRQDSEKLVDSEDFKQVMEGLPKSGFSLEYISPQFLKLMGSHFSGQSIHELFALECGNHTSTEDVLLGNVVADHLAEIAKLIEKEGSGLVEIVLYEEGGVRIESKDIMAAKGVPVSSIELLRYAAVLMYIEQEVEKQLKMKKVTTALNNSKDIYIGIIDYVFNNDDGKMLDVSGMKSANQVFDAFLTSGSLMDEKPFYVQGMKGFQAGDEEVSEEGWLEKGSNCYTYIAGGDMMRGRPNRPLMMIPVFEKDGKPYADRDLLEGNVVVLAHDGSAVVYAIEENGEVLVEGENLLDLSHPVWKESEHNKNPTFFYPER